MTPAEAGLVAQLEATSKMTDPDLREAARVYLGDLLVLEGQRPTMNEAEFLQRRVALVAELAKLDKLEAKEGSDL